jgi:hypothetical protein
MPNGAKEVTALIVDDPQNKAWKESADADEDGPPHVFPSLSIVYTSMQQVYASSKNKSRQGRVGDLMKCRISDVEVDGSNGDCRKRQSSIDTIC